MTARTGGESEPVPDRGPRRRGRPEPPRLMVITDTTVAAEPELVERIDAVLAAARPGTVVVQLRDLGLSARERLRLGRRLVERCRRYGQRFIVNDRCDLAVLLGADGVHLGERSIRAGEARRLVGAGAWISAASHDPGRAPEPEADAVVLSPIVAARKGRKALGFGALGRARHVLGAARGSVALYALGGVGAESAAACRQAGADGVAVIGAALDGRPVEPLVDALGVARQA